VQLTLTNDVIWQEFTPARTARVRKQIWDNDKREFVVVHFVRVFTLTRRDLDQAREWHRENYGAPVYLGHWWHDDHSIWLRESLATFWLLAHLGE